MVCEIYRAKNKLKTKRAWEEAWQILQHISIKDVVKAQLLKTFWHQIYMSLLINDIVAKTPIILYDMLE